MENKERIYGQGLSLIAIVLIGILIITILFGAYLALHKNSLNKTKTEGETKLTEIQNEISKLEEQKLPILVHASELQKQNEQSIQWSKVVENLNKATPKDVFIKSYNGHKSGQIFIAAEAQTSKKISELIDILAVKDFLNEVFVPSITKGTNEKGAVEYSFNLELDYAKVAQE